MKKLSFILLTIFAALSFNSCDSNDYELESITFIPDENNPQIPKYTEYGYNTFGAKYDRDYLIYDRSNTTSKFFVNNGTLRFTMYGQIERYTYNENNYDLLFTINDFKDLEQLRNKSFNLRDTAKIKLFINDTISKNIIPDSGNIDFNCVRTVLVDGKEIGKVVAGRFNFNYLTENEEIITVADGRFDFFVNETNYYKR